MDDIRYLITEYEKELVVPILKPTHQYLLCTIGLIGAGKTTVIKPLAERLSLLRISTDEVRYLVYKYKQNFNKIIDDTILRATIDELFKKYLRMGYSIAIDADCVSSDAQQKIKMRIKEFNVMAIWIHINPPEQFIIDKLTRYNHTWLYKNADQAIENYMARKVLHKDLTMPFVYIFDTSKSDLEKQINDAKDIIETKTNNKFIS